MELLRISSVPLVTAETEIRADLGMDDGIATQREVRSVDFWCDSAAVFHGDSSSEQRMIQISPPDIPIGKLLATPATLETLQVANVDIIELVERHFGKDWGDVSDEDKRLNDDALHDGSRILSSDILPGNVTIPIITEAEDDSGLRRSTTALLPAES